MCNSIVTPGGAEMSGGEIVFAGEMTNWAGMRALALGAGCLLRCERRPLGTSGGWPLLVAVDVVPTVIVAAECEAEVEVEGVVPEAPAEVVVVWEDVAPPPQPARAIAAAAATRAVDAQRGIGAV
jgi:hypothetical protein